MLSEGNIHLTEPRNVVRNRLDLLRFRYTLLSKLYSDLSSIYLPCVSFLVQIIIKK